MAARPASGSGSCGGMGAITVERRSPPSAASIPSTNISALLCAPSANESCARRHHAAAAHRHQCIGPRTGRHKETAASSPPDSKRAGRVALVPSTVRKPSVRVPWSRVPTVVVTAWVRATIFDFELADQRLTDDQVGHDVPAGRRRRGDRCCCWRCPRWRRRLVAHGERSGAAANDEAVGAEADKCAILHPQQRILRSSPAPSPARYQMPPAVTVAVAGAAKPRVTVA